MSYEEAALVPLSDELRGSLRMIAPKGCAIRYYYYNYYYYYYYSLGSYCYCY